MNFIRKYIYKFLYWYYQWQRYNHLEKKYGFVEQKVSIGSNSIQFYISPSGHKNIVFIHGLLDASFGFRKMIPHLSRDWKIYLLDIPSFGKSKLPSNPAVFQMDIFVDMIYRSLRELDLRDVCIVGHSMGGLIAQHLALLDQKKDNRINKLILLSPGNSPHPKRDEMRKLLFPSTKEEIARLLGELYHFTKEEPGDLVKNTLLYAWNSEEYHHLAENTISREFTIFLGEKSKEIQIPSFILVGENDQITTVDSIKKLGRYLPNGKVEIIPEAKHAIHLEHSIWISKFINNLLDEHENNK